MKRLISIWSAVSVGLLVLSGCGGGSPTMDGGGSDSAELDSAQLDQSSNGPCHQTVCGANASCVVEGTNAVCMCTSTAIDCDGACVLPVVDQAPNATSTVHAAFPDDESLGCVGQTVRVGRSGELTSLRVVLPTGTPFTVDVGVLYEHHEDLGTAQSAENWRTCGPANLLFPELRQAEGEGRSPLCTYPEACPLPLPEHYTSVVLDPPLAVQAGDIVYAIFRFDTTSLVFPAGFPTFVGSAYERRGTNVDGDILVFQTDVASCD